MAFIKKGLHKKVEWALPILPKSQKANRINSLWMTKKYNLALSH